jgi:hypothetical protein
MPAGQSSDYVAFYRPSQDPFVISPPLQLKQCTIIGHGIQDYCLLNGMAEELLDNYLRGYFCFVFRS